MGDEISARDGDVLVVQYPDIKVPVAPYCTVGIGGLTYTRVLREGDDASEQYKKIYDFLERVAMREGRAKIAAWSEEIAPKKADKPAGVRR